MISYNDFQKLDLRIGKIISAVKVEGAEKLIKLEVDLGNEIRQIIAGMAEFFEPEYLLGKQVPVIMNLAPRKFRGLESRGMILAADLDGKPVLLHPEREVPAGTIIR
jgi:methionine--tRNA ligase beta chain